MRPILLQLELPILGRVAFPGYITMLGVGFALALLITWRDARRQGINPDRIIDLNLYLVICGVLGARLMHILADGHLMDYVNMCLAPETIAAVGNVPPRCTADAQCGEYFLCNVAAGHCHPPRDCLLALKMWRGGLTYYGGFIGAIAFGLYYARKHFASVYWRVWDMAGYAVPLGLFFGRMGCWFNGCCYGKLTGGPLGVIFPHGSEPWHHQLERGLVDAAAAAPLPVHPTQLYSALLNLAIFFFCYLYLRTHKRFDGQVFWTFVALKAVTRSLVEILRDDDRGGLLGLSTSQLVSLVLLAVAVAMLLRLRRRGARRGAPAPAAPGG